jgi:hypothetical protein
VRKGVSVFQSMASPGFGIAAFYKKDKIKLAFSYEL